VLRAIVAGVLLALGSAPNNHWFLGLCGLAVFYVASDRPTWRVRLRIGWVTAFVMFVVTLSWSRQFSLPGWPLLAAFEALFFAAAATLTPSGQQGLTPSTPSGRQGWWRRWLVFPAAVALAELLRIRWPLGGFPMGSFTTGQVDGPLASTVRLFGEPGLALIATTTAVAVVEIVRRRKVAPLASLAAIAALAIYSSSLHTHRTGTLVVATVQAGGPLGVGKDLQNPPKVFADHYVQTAHVSSPVDLILWPEDVVQVEQPIATSAASQVMSNLTQIHQTSIVAGVVEILPGHRFRNTAVAWNDSGHIASSYDKVQRVPFGEYLPARGLLEHTPIVRQLPSDAIAGHATPVLDVDDHRYAVAVSYEAMFARQVRNGVKAGGELVLVPTNAASYTSSRVAKTQVAAARLRALESGRWVVQAAPTGISAFVDDDGKVRDRSTIGNAAVLQNTVTLHHGLTPYTRFGDVPLAALSLLAVAAGYLRWGARNVRREQGRGLARGARTESC
jgi:apolipoprotein N-acyltransferase